MDLDKNPDANASIRVIELKSLRDESLELGIWQISSPSFKALPGTVESEGL